MPVLSGLCDRVTASWGSRLQWGAGSCYTVRNDRGIPAHTSDIMQQARVHASIFGSFTRRDDDEEGMKVLLGPALDH